MTLILHELTRYWADLMVNDKVGRISRGLAPDTYNAEIEGIENFEIVGNCISYEIADLVYTIPLNSFYRLELYPKNGKK